jgi:hypothetical protein
VVGAIKTGPRGHGPLSPRLTAHGAESCPTASDSQLTPPPTTSVHTEKGTNMNTVCACLDDQVCALCVGLTDPEVIAVADDCLRELGLAWLTPDTTINR